MISYAKTEDIKEISENLERLAQELEDNFTTLFARLSKVPEETKEWVGGQAKKYFETISKDETEYKKVSTRIKEFSNELKLEVNSLESLISECDKE